MQFISNSPEETISIAKEFTKTLKPNDVIAFSGTLGAGKTVFTKGVALALNINQIITSPTFTLIQEYEAPIPLFHMDLYRIENSEELELLGVEDYFFKGGITLIEWSQKAQEILPSSTYYIDINVSENGTRQITISTKEQGA